MSEIRVEQKHSLPVEDAKGRVAAFEEMLTKYGVKVDWKGPTGTLKGTGVGGTIAVTPSAVQIEVKLGLMARAVVDSTKLKASIEKRLKAAFEA